MNILKGKLNSVLALSVFMTTAIPQGLQAHSVVDYKMEINDSSKQIENVFKKFQYETTVNWDQKDPIYLEDAQKDLINSLEDLKMSGVTDEQIQDYMLKNITNDNARRDYVKLIETMKKQGISGEEAAEKMMEFMKKNHVQGVGFAGGASGGYNRVGIVLGIIVVGVVTYIIIKNKHHNEEPQEEETDTTTGEPSNGGHYDGKWSGKHSGKWSGKHSGNYNGWPVPV